MLNLFGGLPSGFSLKAQSIISQTHVNSETILVALAAGMAGMLALETRASAAVGVGVAISVTTIPAAAFLGVAAGIGELSNSLAALRVPGAHVAMMLASGSLTLVVQGRGPRRSAVLDGKPPSSNRRQTRPDTRADSDIAAYPGERLAHHRIGMKIGVRHERRPRLELR